MTDRSQTLRADGADWPSKRPEGLLTVECRTWRQKLATKVGQSAAGVGISRFGRQCVVDGRRRTKAGRDERIGRRPRRPSRHDVKFPRLSRQTLLDLIHTLALAVPPRTLPKRQPVQTRQIGANPGGVPHSTPTHARCPELRESPTGPSANT